MNPEMPRIIFGSVSMLGLGGWLLPPLVLGFGRRLAQHPVADLEERLAERMLTAGNGESARIEGGRS